MEAWKLIREAWMLKMASWGGVGGGDSRPVVTDLHHFDEDQAPVHIRIEVKNRIKVPIKAKTDPDPHLSDADQQPCF